MRTAKVLVVEDDARIREDLAEMLQSAGFEVESAGDGERGLELAPGADLVLLNLGLPKLSGLGILRRLRERGDYTPVIVVSGATEYRKEAEECKIVDFVEKPFSARDLMDKILRCLRVGDNMDSISVFNKRLKDVAQKEDTKSRS